MHVSHFTKMQKGLWPTQVDFNVIKEISPPGLEPGSLGWEPSINSATGTQTRVARVRAEYPNQLDCGGLEKN